ncbi:structural maintenance of chromosomes protein [Plakobranchus ocellatus]|uniref:Structural maintenance of chromosomes protein n=3 Tax=Plakobranchus ocellatus TaxID=259542 RepID=A0AAV4E0T6_9GAST|nr:structural maintenance of chromosomes protein [Plakobranchus ocellatus]
MEADEQCPAGDEPMDTESAAAPIPRAPLVFNPEDYGPIEVPEAVQSVASYAPDGPRLMITQIVNENFKSYAGIQTLGPFQKNFTAIIGPNGSGKSNVIDSMLFVFGYRANKIRSKKISVLIHNSEKHKNVNSCSVAVHFQKIVDTGPGDDDYTVVPDSQFVVSRIAYRDNSSSYYLDGKKAAYKEVAHVLRGCGIDLDHNRFLILQGEVEQIAMMKAKAQTEHEDGMLEFLEDIIGSNRFKTPIETLNQRVDTLNDLRSEKLNRVKAVEKEMESLEGPKNEAVEFLKLENAVMKLRNKLYQKYIMECSEIETKAQTEYDRIDGDLKKFKEKVAEIRESKNTKSKEHNKLKKEYDKLLKACEESKEKFSEMESQDAKCHEDIKLNKAKLKKLEKSLELELTKIEELKLVPEQAEKSCEELKKKLASLEKLKAKEEENEKAIMDSLKDETKELQEAKNVKEAKLLEQQEDLNGRKSKLQVAESELEIYTSREQTETKKFETLKKSLKDAEELLTKREKDLKRLDEEVPRVEGVVSKAKQELKQVLNSETQCQEKRASMLSKVEEVKSSMAASKSQNRVLNSLMAEKKKGTLPGIHGRLGDLGAIDSQYDVAISTACGSLDDIVVDTIDTGKKCIEFLKKNNIGQARFILMDKMETWRAETKKKITTPENIPRLFDLVRVKDEAVKTCFYFALRNTLVAKDIDQATRIGYGKTRYRVVTLKGELIELSGGSNINNLRYADDTVLIAENEKDLQQLLDIVKEESEKKGLELNRKKTEVMVVSQKQELPIINIYIKGTRLKQKDQFKYLGSLISSDGRNNSEVASRIAQAKTNFQKMKTVLTNKNISIRTRRRALECYIEPILMYGCEAWTISKQTQRKLEATEMWFLRRMLRISWTAKKTNDTVLEEAHTTRLLISKIRKRQATFFGHVMRREKLENLVTTGMLEGKRSRGKQREKLIEGLTDWLKAGKSLEAIEATKDRKKWRTMIANAVKQGT